jgi:hypothetical protein
MWSKYFLQQSHKQSIYEWKAVEAVEDVDGAVAIFTRDGGGVVIRNRAFRENGECSRFLELARSSLRESRSQQQD